MMKLFLSLLLAAFLSVTGYTAGSEEEKDPAAAQKALCLWPQSLALQNPPLPLTTSRKKS